jgi:hypothetical protein
MWGTVHILRMGNWSWSMREEPSAGTHKVQTTCQPLLLLNVTTGYALSTVIAFECDHSPVHTVIRYYFWMWPQHGTHCHPLLLLNVTTARYTLLTIITFECDHSTVYTVIRYYFWMWPEHTHCQPLLLLNVTTARYALYCCHSSAFISDNRTLNYYSQWILCRGLCQFTCKFILSMFWVTSGTWVVKHLTLT